MADIAESAPFTDPATAISHGKRHLLVRDYTMAVTALAQACQLLAEKHGDTADELGEPYLLYGRALLGLAREEAGVLGGAVPGSEDAEEDDEEDEEEDEKLSNVDEKEEEEEEQKGEGKAESSVESKTDDKKAAEEAAKSEGEKKEEKKEHKTEEKKEKEEKKEEKEEKVEKEEKEEPSAKEEKSEKSDTTEKSESNKTDDSKIAEQVAQKQKTDGDDKEKVTPGSSKETNHANGPSTSTEQNGDLKENGEDSEDVGKDEEEDEVNNLQVAWEVLELAKLVLIKRGPTGRKLLADAYRLLGEVAMEGGNYQGALSDLQRCLELLEKSDPREPRAIAEIHYQLALAHSLGNEFDASIEEFNKATSLLEARIKELEEIKEPPKTDDSFYTVEGEIQELKELLPEIQEKISDMKDFKQEACKLVIEGIKSKVAGGCSNGAGPSGSDPAASSSSSTTPKTQKPASDISHLVRKKRKADETETEVLASPSKKPTPEKAV